MRLISRDGFAATRSEMLFRIVELLLCAAPDAVAQRKDILQALRSSFESQQQQHGASANCDYFVDVLMREGTLFGVPAVAPEALRSSAYIQCIEHVLHVRATLQGNDLAMAVRFCARALVSHRTPVHVCSPAARFLFHVVEVLYRRITTAETPLPTEESELVVQILDVILQSFYARLKAVAAVVERPARGDVKGQLSWKEEVDSIRDVRLMIKPLVIGMRNVLWSRAQLVESGGHTQARQHGTVPTTTAAVLLPLRRFRSAATTRKRARNEKDGVAGAPAKVRGGRAARSGAGGRSGAVLDDDDDEIVTHISTGGTATSISDLSADAEMVLCSEVCSIAAPHDPPSDDAWSDTERPVTRAPSVPLTIPSGSFRVRATRLPASSTLHTSTGGPWAPTTGRFLKPPPKIAWQLRAQGAAANAQRWHCSGSPPRLCGERLRLFPSCVAVLTRIIASLVASPQTGTDDELIENLGSMLTMVDAAVLEMLLRDAGLLDVLVAACARCPAVWTVLQTIAHSKPAPVCELLLDFLLPRLAAMGMIPGLSAAVHLRIFMKVILHPLNPPTVTSASPVDASSQGSTRSTIAKEHTDALRDRLSAFIGACIPQAIRNAASARGILALQAFNKTLSMTPKNPVCEEVSLKYTTALLHLLLPRFSVLLYAPGMPPLAELLTDTVVRFPTRFSVLETEYLRSSYLPLLFRFFVPALQSSQETLALFALKTLESLIDLIRTDHAETLVASVMPDLVAAICKYLRPEPSSLSLPAMRIIAKLSGRARTNTMFADPPSTPDVCSLAPLHVMLQFAVPAMAGGTTELQLTSLHKVVFAVAAHFTQPPSFTSSAASSLWASSCGPASAVIRSIVALLTPSTPLLSDAPPPQSMRHHLGYLRSDQRFVGKMVLSMCPVHHAVGCVFLREAMSALFTSSIRQSSDGRIASTCSCVVVSHRACIFEQE